MDWKIPHAANRRLVCTHEKAHGQVLCRFLLLQQLLTPRDRIEVKVIGVLHIFKVFSPDIITDI